MIRYNGNKFKGRDGYISRISPITGVRWAWFGGHGIHGYIGKGESKKEVAFLNVGDWSKEGITEEEAKRAVERIAHLTSEEQSQYAVDENEMKLIATGKYRKPYLTYLTKEKPRNLVEV
jgi:hypothetical protein